MKRHLMLLAVSYFVAGFFGLISLVIIFNGLKGVGLVLNEPWRFFLFAVRWPVWTFIETAPSSVDSIKIWSCFLGYFSLFYAMFAHLFPKQQIQKTGICFTCGYDLRATPDRCPECGSVPKRV